MKPGDSDIDVDSLLPPPCAPAAPTPPLPAKKKIRRRSLWGFSLRAFFIGQAIIALLIGTVAVRVRSMKRQQTIVQSIPDGDRPVVRYKTSPATPAWLWGPLCRAFDAEPVDIVSIYVVHHPLSVAEAELLHQLPHLTELTLMRGVSEPAAMRALARCKKLQSLTVRDAEERHLSDEAMSYLVDCKSLRFLAIDSVNITDVGLNQLATLPQVEQLEIIYAKMTIAGLESWILANRVTRLHLPMRLKVTDSESLARFTSLQQLSVYDLDAKGLQHFSQMPQLKELQIRANITGAVQESVGVLPTRINVVNSANYKVTPLAPDN